jgi:thiazole tautomerase (transcriptional regulator TenI)
MSPKAPPVPVPRIPVVHAVTNDEVLARPDFIDRASAIMEAMGPRGAIHLRAHAVPASRLHALALALALAQRNTGAWLVVNDRVDIAMTVHARGVQLTTRSMTAMDARRIAPRLAIGASVHGVEEAKIAEAAGADWIVGGHVFETATHPEAPGRGPALISQITSAVAVPLIAIGGIQPEHVPFLRRAGAHGVAVIRGIWSAPNAERAAIDYFSAYDAHGGSPAGGSTR